ncbi:hypothetical protein ACFYXF_37745 [Streptomyces sp. NPDC002680]|uniref:hypothetical protein n=1 Tax=Streptomyces sp. NPDC002680 TaxID=3364659 RepID=UPI0036B1C9F0
MFRYVHYEVICALLAVCAALVSAVVVFGVEGVPETPGGADRAIVLGLVYLALVAGFGVLTVSRIKWFGEGRDFDKAVPLRDPASVLPTRGEGYRNCVNVLFFVLLAASAVGGGLFLERDLALFPLVFVPAWSARAWWVARWERRHGLLLWRGRIRTQPLEDDQYLYSSVRQPEHSARNA